MIPGIVASPSDPLGYDFKVGQDLDPSGRSATGIELCEDAILHRLMQDELLMAGAPGDQIPFGEDVRKWVGEALSQDALNARAPRVEEVIRRDVRFADVAVSLRKATGSDASRWDLFVSVRVTLITGEILDRIVGVDLVTVEFLAAGK